MRRARTRYVPGGTPAIRYRPSEPVTAPSDPPATVTVAPVRGAPVCCVVTAPAIRPISWARSAQTGDNASAPKTARRFMEAPPTVERSVATAPRALRALHGLHAALRRTSTVPPSCERPARLRPVDEVAALQR